MPALAQRSASPHLSALLVVPACLASASRGAAELDGQGVLEVVVPRASVPPPLPASRWAGVRCAVRARRPRVRRRWAGLGRRLGPCPLALPALAAIEGARVLGAPVWRQRAALAVATVRSDYAETLGAIVTALADDAESGSTAAPTWAALAAAAGCVERTVGRWIAWLRKRRLLVTVEHGSTEQFRPRFMALEGNRAAVYLLTEPAPQVDDHAVQPAAGASGAPPGSGSDVGVIPPASPRKRRREEPPRGRESGHTGGDERPVDTLPPWGAAGKDAKDEERPQEQRQGRYQRAPGATRGEQRAADLAIAAALRRSALDLRSISDAAVRSVIRPLTGAGWTLADLIHAIDHEPNGARRWYTCAPTLPVRSPDVDGVQPLGRRERPAAPVGSPAAWLRWRLSPWQGLEGPAAARRAATLAGQRAATLRAAQRRAEAVATKAARTTAPSGFAAARAALHAAARPSAAARSLQPWVPGDLDARRQGEGSGVGHPAVAPPGQEGCFAVGLLG